MQCCGESVIVSCCKLMGHHRCHVHASQMFEYGTTMDDGSDAQNVLAYFTCVVVSYVGISPVCPQSTAHLTPPHSAAYRVANAPRRLPVESRYTRLTRKRGSRVLLPFPPFP